MNDSRTSGAIEMASTAHGFRELRSFDVDFYGWVTDQVALIEARRFDAVDWRNVIEELMAAARSEERALESQFDKLLLHLLKWRYQREKRSGSWQAAIINARARMEKALRRSPSLTSELDETFRDAYQIARREAGAQMGCSRDEWEHKLPENCPWTLEQVRGDFWPED
jgi:Domain of unknown function DUF29